MSEFDKYIVQGEPDKRHHGSCKSTTLRESFRASPMAQRELQQREMLLGGDLSR